MDTTRSAPRPALTDEQIGELVVRAERIVSESTKLVPSATDAVRAVVLATLIDQCRDAPR